MFRMSDSPSISPTPQLDALNYLNDEQISELSPEKSTASNCSQNVQENSSKKTKLPHTIQFGSGSNSNIFEFKGNPDPKNKSSKSSKTIDDQLKNVHLSGSSSSNDRVQGLQIPSDWRKGRKGHTERMEYLLDSGFLSDVTFLVGDDKIEIKAHRAILAIGSPVFQAMLTGKSYVEGQPIPIPDLSPFEFKSLLKYLYIGEQGISSWTTLPLFQAAKKFSIDELTEKCVEQMIESLTHLNVCYIYEQALTYKEVKLEKKAEEYILKNARYIVETPGFLQLSQANLLKIISNDELQVIDEIQLIKAVYSWGKLECKTQKMAETPDNIRLALKPMISQIRIPQMDASSFSIHVAPLEILTEKELISSLLSFNVAKSTRSNSHMTISGFNSMPRNYFQPTGPVYQCQIQPEPEQYKITTSDENDCIEHSGNWWSINFFVDREIWIKSIGLFLYNYQDYTNIRRNYGGGFSSTDLLFSNGFFRNYKTNTTSSQYICKLKIEEKGMSQDFVEKILQGSCDIQDISFETPVHIQANKYYTISLFTVGPATLGIKSEQIIQVPTDLTSLNGPVTFSFNQNPLGVLKKIATIDFLLG